MRTKYWTKVLINSVKIFGAEYFLVDNMNSILHPNRKHGMLGDLTTYDVNRWINHRVKMVTT